MRRIRSSDGIAALSYIEPHLVAAPNPIRPSHEQPAFQRDEAGVNPDRLTPLRELQLLEKHRAGGNGAQEALAELLTGYQRRIYSVCARMLRNREDAADLTHDVLIKVIEGLPSYNGQSKLSTWIIRVAMNCCLTHLRKQKLRAHERLDSSGVHHERGGTGGREMSGRGQAHSDFSDAPPTGPDSIGSGISGGREPWPGQRIEQEQTRDLILKAMNDLDAEMRAILVLRDVQDLDYQQLAEVLDIPIGTVKSRLFRARAALRHAIELRGGP